MSQFPPSEAADRTAIRQLSIVRRALFLGSFPVALLTFGLPIYGLQLHASAFAIGALFSTFNGMAVVTRPFAGRAIDRYGRRPFFLLGLAGYAISMLFFAVSPLAHSLGVGIGVLLIGRAIQGASSAFLLLASYAMVADLAVAAGRGQSFGAVEEMQQRGGLYGIAAAIPIFAGVAIATHASTSEFVNHLIQAWPLVFGLYTIIILAALWYARRHLAETFARPVSQGVLPGEGRFHRQLFILMAIVFVTSSAYQGITPTILIFLQQHYSQDLLLLGLAYLPSAIMWSFAPSRMGKLADRVGRKPPIAAALFSAALVALLLPNLPGPDRYPADPEVAQLLALLPLSFFWAMEALSFTAAVPAEQALVADISGARNRGFGFGLYTLSINLGAVVGPLLMGALYDRLNALPFYIEAFMLVCGAGAMLLLIQDPHGLALHTPEGQSSGGHSADSKSLPVKER